MDDMKNGPKYVIMNGSCGCMPDNYMYAESIDSAIEQIDSLFDGLPRGAKKELRESRIYYFGYNTCAYGAEYVEISDNIETTYDDIEKGF
jgi:hypothetical protein